MTADAYQSRYAGMDYQRLLDLAVEALERTNMHNSPGHPEDLAAHLSVAIECVAVGFGAGIRFEQERITDDWILGRAKLIQAKRSGQAVS